MARLLCFKKLRKFILKLDVLLFFVGFQMNASNRTSRRVGIVLKAGIPFEGNRRAAGN